MFFIYYTILIPTLLCTQSLAHISSILFTRNVPSAMLVSQVVLNILSMMSNSLIPLKTMHYSIQMLSDLSFLKFTHDFITLNTYGLGRCASNEISTVLYIFGIDDDMYWPVINKMIINVVIYKIITFSIFIIKFKSISGSKIEKSNSKNSYVNPNIFII